MKRVALILLVLGAAAPADAREWRISIQGGSTRILDGGFLVAQDSGWLTNSDVGVEAELAWGLFAGLKLGGGGGTSPALFGTLTSDLGLIDLQATARWHVEVLSWLRPFAEVGAGASRISLELRGADVDEARWTALLTGFAGLELRMPPSWLFGGSFSAGLQLAGGFTWRSQASFDDVGGTDLGALDIHGGTWRVGVVLSW